MHINKISKKSIKKWHSRSIILVAGIFTLIITTTFMIAYLLIENLGYHSTFSFATSIWMRSVEGYIFFTIMLSLSIFFGSIIVLYLLKR